MNTPVKVPPVRVVFEEADRKWLFERLDEVLSGGMVAAGKYVQEFEQFWATYTRCQHAIAVSSGGAALDVIMRGLNVAGKDVLVPTNTFIATVNAVLAAGGNPVFLDADRRTMGVGLEEVKRKFTQNTAGAIVVHVGGIISPEIETIASWCKQRGIWLVEDAAHAQGSELNGKRAGEFGVAAAYSFFATKIITSGEGGMVVTNDERLANFCRSYRDYGKKSQWESVHTLFGSNLRISEITALVGLCQSRRMDEFIESRSNAASQYTKELRGVIELVLPPDRCSWYKYIALLPEGVDRDKFRTELKARNVSLSGGVYDLPVHLQPVFQHENLAGTLPEAEDVCRRHICLPIFYGMATEQIEHAIVSVSAVLENCRA